METAKEKFEQFGIVEMMGHRKVAARVSDAEIGGSSLLRLDVLGGGGEIERTEYIGVASIYCLTIVTEETAKLAAINYSLRPAWAYDVERANKLLNATNEQIIDANDDDDDDDGVENVIVNRW